MVFHPVGQGGLGIVFHQGQSLIRLVFHQCGIRMVFHQVVSHQVDQGGFSSCLWFSSGWSWSLEQWVCQGGLRENGLISVVFHEHGFWSGLSLVKVVFHQGVVFKVVQSWWSFIRMVFDQGGLLSVRSHIRSGCSFIRSGWSLIRLVSHHCDLASVWFFIIGLFGVVFSQSGLSSFYQDSLSSRWSFGAVFHQSGLSLGWSLVRLVFHQGDLSSWAVFHQGGRAAFYQGGLSSGSSFIEMVFYRCGLSSGWSFT